MQGELLTPSAMPMSTEWKAMPVSSTCGHMRLQSQQMAAFGLQVSPEDCKNL